MVKQLSQKRLMIIGGVIVVAILIAVALLWQTVWSQPTKKDYQDAKTAVKGISEKYEDLSIAQSAYTSSLATAVTGKKVATTKPAYEKAVDNLNTAFDKLQAMPALKNDKVEAAFEELDNQKVKFIAYTDGFALYRTSLLTCADAFDVTDNNKTGKTIADAHKKATEDCLPTLDSLKSSDVKIFASYAKGFASVLRDRQATFDDYASDKLNDNQASKKITELGKELQTVFNTTNGLQKARDDASTFGQLKKMNQVLDEQIKQA